jgi:hypothetical protein
MLTQMTINPSEKQGLSSTLGCAQNINLIYSAATTALTAAQVTTGFIAGVSLPVTVTAGATYNSSSNLSYLFNATNAAGGNLTTTFAIPIIGILNSTKMLPMFGGDLIVEFTVADISRWLVKTAGATANTAIANMTFTLDNLELVYDSIELSPESHNMVMAAYPQKLIIKSQSYNFGSVSLGICL